jgi:hypothetical protein
MISAPVKGLMPLRALVAGLRSTVIFIRPGTVNTPAPLPTARPVSVGQSRSGETCLRVSFVPSAMLLMISPSSVPCLRQSDLLVWGRSRARIS